ncbi:putative TPR-repeat-containing chaperone protein DNAJ [Trypanosoma rangeli]|uniref:Putative TPR-repeat-containing chaperone protein DNAJ n=1 Tax=Trypanosoma rangeli TaxID=5698 RepID=A0A422NYH9_TRYRA|nr:putative TPR-repeat-containing chaperone protein DNAJ [Trypanosoma rangeli]RNF10471.1 putative TPR-repeat-containing chaperone protein DNAJ [Trypanosoma rangeli]|eukprot:RNF10471.1 putative TPR-repeat-containing chaperone protein DNAJ [Trypanosoma rangeli]
MVAVSFLKRKQRQKYWTCLRLLKVCQQVYGDALQRLQPQGGQSFWSLSTRYIPRVAAAMPHLPSSRLSSCIRLVLRHKRYNSVDMVLQLAAERGVVPEMVALVEVFESVYDIDGDAAQLERVVRSARSLFAECAPAVFRAFAERTAG